MSNPIVKALQHSAQKLGKTLAQDAGKAVKDFYRKTGTNLQKVAHNTRQADAKHAAEMDKLLKGGGKDLPHPGSGGAGGARGGASHPQGRGRDQVRDPRTEGRAHDSRCGGGEPVDMATGRMYIDQVDASLPGSLPLLFTRNFESGYVAGRWMGPKWVCTFDERLEIDAEGVVHIRADRITQAYPHPEPGETVEASAGDRRELRLAPGGYHVRDRSTGLTREFTVSAGGTEALLTRVRDCHGRHYTLAYDEDGVPLSITHSGGYELRVTVDADRITALRLANATETGGEALLLRYGYTDGHLSAVYNSSGKPMRFANDASGRILSWTDRNDSRYLYVYDDLDRVVDEGGADGTLRFHFTYGAPDPATGLRTHTETNALGHTTTYTVNEHAQITAITDPLGHTTHYERDQYDALLSETDPLGRTTRYAYDGAGDLISVTRPDGEQTIVVHDGPFGLPTTVTEPGGAVWQQTYDDAGNHTSLTDPLGAVTQYAYDDLGHLAAVRDALGHVTRVKCNAAGLPVETVEPGGATVCYERDAFGRVVAIADQAGAVTRLTWSVEGYPTSQVLPGGEVESWNYDGEGNCLTYTDRLGQTTAFTYTHFETLASRTGPDGARHSFTYDAQMQLVAVTDALGQQWTYAYDAAGRVIAERDSAGRTISYQLDALGRPTVVTDPLGRHTRFMYDRLGRTTMRDAEGSLTTYEYNVAGDLVRATSPDADVVREVDLLGRLRTEMTNGRTISYSYDQLHRRVRRVTPTGHVSAWSYDPSGHCTGLVTTGGTMSFEFDEAGRECRRIVNGRLTLASSWDTEHRLTGQSLHAGNSLLHARDYSYRADGGLTAISDHLAGHRTITLDSIGRVTAVRAATWNESYAYDTVGNLIAAEWPASSRTKAAVGPRTYAGSELTVAGRVRYEYDAAGRTTLRQVSRLSRKPDTWRYSWDTEGRLTEVATPDGSHWRYLYDPFGRRIAKHRLSSDSSQVTERTHFTWDGATLAEQTTHADYLPGPHTLSWDHQDLHPLAQTETITTQERIDQRFFAVITDLVGAPSELVDPETESIAWRGVSTLWGLSTWRTDSTTYTPLRFPGQYFDPETGLHYNVHRFYDPETARFISTDPLGLAPAPNPYSYVPNPHTWSDPLGLSPHPKKKAGERSPSPGRLSDRLPRGLPKEHVRAYDEIRAGRGVPQTHPNNHPDLAKRGRQKIFGGKKKHEAFWKGAREWRVPGEKDGDSWRILEKTLPDGRKVMGWTTDHYTTIHPFAAPHFPDSGWR